MHRKRPSRLRVKQRLINSIKQQGHDVATRATATSSPLPRTSPLPWPRVSSHGSSGSGRSVVQHRYRHGVVAANKVDDVRALISTTSDRRK